MARSVQLALERAVAEMGIKAKIAIAHSDADLGKPSEYTREQLSLVKEMIRDIADQQLQFKTITEDQVRLRANLKEMPPTAAAYKRYLDKFDQQETQIEKYQAGIKMLQETEHQQQKEFEDFLNNFSAE